MEERGEAWLPLIEDNRGKAQRFHFKQDLLKIGQPMRHFGGEPDCESCECTAMSAGDAALL